MLLNHQGSFCHEKISLIDFNCKEINPKLRLLTFQLNKELSLSDLESIECQFRRSSYQLNSFQALEFYSAFFSYPSILEASEEGIFSLFESTIHTGHGNAFIKGLLLPPSKAVISEHLLRLLLKSLSDNAFHFPASECQNLYATILSHHKANLFSVEDLLSIAEWISDIQSLEKKQHLEMFYNLADHLGSHTLSSENLWRFICIVSVCTEKNELLVFTEHPFCKDLAAEAKNMVHQLFTPISIQKPSNRFNTSSPSEWSDIESEKNLS